MAAANAVWCHVTGWITAFRRLSPISDLKELHTDPAGRRGGGGAGVTVIERSWPTLPREEVEGEEEEEEGCRRLCWEEEESFCKKAPADADVM